MEAFGLRESCNLGGSKIMKTQFSRRELYAMGEPLGESATRVVAGRRIYGGGGGIGGVIGDAIGEVGNAVSGVFVGGGSSPATPAKPAGTSFSNTSPAPQSNPTVNPMTQTDAQQGIAGYAQPYVNTMLGSTMQNLFDYDANGNATGMKQYNPYSYNPADYVAGFSPLQQQAQQGIANLQAPAQNQQAMGYANQAIQGLMGQQYNPQTGGYSRVNAPSLQNFQMGQAQQVSADKFGGQSAQDYMNPYMQNVVDIQQREAQRQADIAGTGRGAQAVKSGAFGGSRQAVMDAEAARNLAIQKGDIQAQGLNSAYTNAQQQFNADQARQMQAQQANQGAGLTTGQANLNSLLGVQNLGAGQNLAAQQANQQARQSAQNLAAQQQQFGANYGMQGLQSALSGANTLGNLGTSNLNNQLGVLNAQQNAGLTQQQQQQNIINQGVNNYNTAQQYPMQQLGQMKSMLQGLPITTTSTQNYQAAPTNLQNIMALGMGGYGLNQLMGGGGSGGSGGGGITSLLNQGASGLGSLVSGASNLASGAGNLISSGWDAVSSLFEEGGQVKSYAQGGVTSEDNVRSIADFLPTQQLPKSFQMAQGRGDFNAQDALQQEMAERASLQRGLGGAFNQLPQGAQESVIRAAGGGIVAFGDPTLNPEENQVVSDTETADNLPSAGNPRLQGVYGNKLLDLVTRMEQDTGPKLMTPGEVSAAEEAAFSRMQKRAGPAPYDMLKKQLTQDEAARGDTLAQGRGLAALQAMSGMLQPGGAMRGLGAAGSAFASSYGDALKADKAEKRYIGQMQFNLADAERKERMGLHKEARADVQSAQQNQINAYKARNLKDQAMGNILGKGMQATRTTGSGADGAGKVKVPEQVMAMKLALARMDPSDPKYPQAKKDVEAAENVLAQTTRLPGTLATITGANRRKLGDQMATWTEDKAYKKAQLYDKQNGTNTAQDLYDAEYARREADMMRGVTTLKAKGGIISPIKLD
jgi:hypothetical protein